MLLVAPHAHAADEDTRVAILPIEFEGTPGAGVANRMQEELNAALGRGSFEIIDSAKVDSTSTNAKSCKDSGCYRDIARDNDATHLVKTSVTIRSRDYDVKMELIAADGSVVASAQELCEICGLDEAAGLISAKAAVLVSQLESAASGAPVLVVSSSPPGAQVFVDGESVGETPYEGELPAGKHIVRVSERGYVSVEREITLAAGVRSSAEFQLEQVPLAEPAIKRGARPWGWAALGGGIALLGGGVALLAIDDMENEGRCSGENQDDDGDCKFLYNTQWGGASLAVAGAIAGTVGVAILIATRRQGKGSKLRAAVGPRGVALQGRF